MDRQTRRAILLLALGMAAFAVIVWLGSQGIIGG